MLNKGKFEVKKKRKNILKATYSNCFRTWYSKDPWD